MKNIGYENLASSKMDLEIIINGELRSAVNDGDVGNAVFSAGQLAMLERFWERILFMVNNNG